MERAKVASALLLLTTLVHCTSETSPRPPLLTCDEGCGLMVSSGARTVLVPGEAGQEEPLARDFVEPPTSGVVNPGLTNLGGGPAAGGLTLGNRAGGPGVGPMGGAGTTGAGGVGGSAAGGGSAGGTGGSAAGGATVGVPAGATTPGGAAPMVEPALLPAP